MGEDLENGHIEERKKHFEILIAEVEDLFQTILSRGLDIYTRLHIELIYDISVVWKERYGESNVDRSSFYHLLIGSTPDRRLSPDLDLEGGGC